MATRSIRKTAMADRVVVDASVALAYLTDEIWSPQARQSVAQWQASATELLVPAHFWLEVTNFLVGRRKVSPDQAVAVFVDLDVLDLRTLDTDRPLLLLAMDHMARSRLTAYDAIYLALALSTGSKLATLDRLLADAAGPYGLLIGSRGISETRAPYRDATDDYTGWAHSAVVGAHIAELRREALAKT